MRDNGQSDHDESSGYSPATQDRSHRDWERVIPHLMSGTLAAWLAPVVPHVDHFCLPGAALVHIEQRCGGDQVAELGVAPGAGVEVGALLRQDGSYRPQVRPA